MGRVRKPLLQETPGKPKKARKGRPPRRNTASGGTRTRPISAREAVRADPRRHLTVAEVDRLLGAITGTRHEARDRALVLLMFRHGLRVSEACGLELGHVDLDRGQIHVSRLKRGLRTTHPLRPDEIRTLRTWLRHRPVSRDPHLFVSERGGPLTRRGVCHLLVLYGTHADLPLRVHPHMLRHACGYALAEQGADAFLLRDYLGHRSVSTTNIYVASNPRRFAALWRA